MENKMHLLRLMLFLCGRLLETVFHKIEHGITSLELKGKQSFSNWQTAAEANPRAVPPEAVLKAQRERVMMDRNILEAHAAWRTQKQASCARAHQRGAISTTLTFLGQVGEALLKNIFGEFAFWLLDLRCCEGVSLLREG